MPLNKAPQSQLPPPPTTMRPKPYLGGEGTTITSISSKFPQSSFADSNINLGGSPRPGPSSLEDPVAGNTGHKDPIPQRLPSTSNKSGTSSNDIPLSRYPKDNFSAEAQLTREEINLYRAQIPVDQMRQLKPYTLDGFQHVVFYSIGAGKPVYLVIDGVFYQVKQVYNEIWHIVSPNSASNGAYPIMIAAVDGGGVSLVRSVMAQSGGSSKRPISPSDGAQPVTPNKKPKIEDTGTSAPAVAGFLPEADARYYVADLPSESRRIRSFTPKGYPHIVSFYETTLRSGKRVIHWLDPTGVRYEVQLLEGGLWCIVPQRGYIVPLGGDHRIPIVPGAVESGGVSRLYTQPGASSKQPISQPDSAQSVIPNGKPKIEDTGTSASAVAGFLPEAEARYYAADLPLEQVGIVGKFSPEGYPNNVFFYETAFESGRRMIYWIDPTGVRYEVQLLGGNVWHIVPQHYTGHYIPIVPGAVESGGVSRMYTQPGVSSKQPILSPDGVQPVISNTNPKIENTNMGIPIVAGFLSEVEARYYAANRAPESRTIEVFVPDGYPNNVTFYDTALESGKRIIYWIDPAGVRYEVQLLEGNLWYIVPQRNGGHYIPIVPGAVESGGVSRMYRQSGASSKQPRRA